MQMGVNPAYKSLAFYKASLTADEQRVSRLFEAAPAAGIRLWEGRLPSSRLKALLLTREAVLLVLVDARHLSCSDCDSGILRRLFRSALRPFTFTGHYVLLIGYDGASDHFIFMDPASRSQTCYIGAAQLDKARFSEGTDEDILIIRHIHRQ